MPKTAGAAFSTFEHLTLGAETAKVHKALRRATRSVQTLQFPRELFEADPKQLAVQLRHYLREQYHREPARFYRVPESAPRPIISSPHVLPRGEVVDLVFPSSFKPSFGRQRRERVRQPAERHFTVKLWQHPPGESLGTLVAVHGWLLSDSRLSALTLVPGYFYRLGLDVVLYELPYHGTRAPAGATFPLFPSADLVRTNEGFAEAIHDLRSLCLWLESRNSKPIGALGLSLGAYTASLWASLDPLAFVISASPLVSLADFVWDVLQQTEGTNAAAAKLLRLFDLETLREVYALHCPLSYPVKVARDSRLILASTRDTIVPPAQPQSLWEHWERPWIEWLSGDHFSQLVDPRTLEKIRLFLSSLDLAHGRPLDL